MKIGIVCYPTHGGSGVVASELAIGLANRGHEVHIISYATPFRLRSFHQQIYVHEVNVATYPLFKYPPYALGLATKLVELVEEYGIELIHAHYAIPHATSAYLAKQILRDHTIKTITTLHGTDITLVGTDQSFHRVIKFTIEESDAVTAVSHYLRQRTIDEFSIQKEIHVIPNFIDTLRCKNNKDACLKTTYAPNNEPILVHASNFRPVKRVGDVTRIFAEVRKQMAAKLIFIGDGPERLFVQQLARELQVQKDVIFLGEQDQMEPLLHCTDLFLLPSEQESFGLAALEAMACGVPVVGTSVGGLPEVVEHGVSGFLAPVGEIREMANYAISLLSDPKKHEAFRVAARRRVMDLYEAQSIIPQYEALYRSLL
ncbi:N-acetyl-alpha-D-glucosaminyl L-malate synthase BshA [candidate division KSB1 bacterium]|nr:N-acetyl-alpha-D-glucosaminyl L-malate synthase BshA [candidate division KSB1 bacterium]